MNFWFVSSAEKKWVAEEDPKRASARMILENMMMRAWV